MLMCVSFYVPPVFLQLHKDSSPHASMENWLCFYWDLHHLLPPFENVQGQNREADRFAELPVSLAAAYQQQALLWSQSHCSKVN